MEIKMSQQLMLLRHGKSDWKTALDDFNRPLKKRGKRASQAVGHWLKSLHKTPDYIISSPAERARQTALYCAEQMGIAEHLIHFDKRIYEAGVEDLLQVLTNIPPEVQRILLIGHNPGLEMLLAYLASEPLTSYPDGKLLATATLAELSIESHLQNLTAGCVRDITIIRPDSLPGY
jgi:phosphohistidine phosphatase